MGVALAETIQRLYEDGTTPRLEAMRVEVPAGVLEMLAVPGLRPPRVLELFRKLGVASLEDLEAACRQDRLKQAKGFGPSFQAKVLAGIELLRRSRGQRLIHHAAEHLGAWEITLRRMHPELSRIVPAGDFRRGSELVSELALLPSRRMDPALRLLMSRMARCGSRIGSDMGSPWHSRPAHPSTWTN